MRLNREYLINYPHAYSPKVSSRDSLFLMVRFQRHYYVLLGHIALLCKTFPPVSTDATWVPGGVKRPADNSLVSAQENEEVGGPGRRSKNSLITAIMDTFNEIHSYDLDQHLLLWKILRNIIGYNIKYYITLLTSLTQNSKDWWQLLF